MRLPRPTRRRNSILLTSLVDVLFVLLFFFMLTSSVLDWRSVSIDTQATAPPVPAKPPARVVASPGARADATQVLEVLPGRLLKLGDADAFALEALPAQLSAHGVRAVTVMPVAGVPLQDLVDVIEALRRSAVGLTLARAP